eukprot:GHVP01032225.1.p1 GENE.GHVP01032225.1~~GHVP01032225.1.p1  ORF type:complete len:597 (-),score=101.46 GHVP01032225.1:1552-3342(-)
MGLGQLNQCGLICAFNAIDESARVARLGIMTSFNVLNFYPLLLAWSCFYMMNSFYKELPWAMTQGEEDFCYAATNFEDCNSRENCIWDKSKYLCSPYLFKKAASFLMETCNIQEEPLDGITAFSWFIVASFGILWLLVFLGISRGARFLGYLTYFTMTIPAINLIFLMIVGLTLDGASIGLYEYIGKLDFSSWKNGDLWAAAMAQAIFSMGAVMGTFCGYSSHNSRSQNFVQDGFVVAFGDFIFAFVSGLASFSIAGHLAKDAGIKLDELPLAGSGLVFETYPVAFATLGYPLANISSFLFFLTLWLLGYTTCVGVLEAITMTVSDSKLFNRLGRIKTVGFLCCLLFTMNIPYATNMGYSFLDLFDHFSTEFSAIIFAFMFGAATWTIQKPKMEAKFGKPAFWCHMSTYLGSCIACPFVVYYKPIEGIVFQTCCIFGGIGIAMAFVSKKNRDQKCLKANVSAEDLKELLFGGIEELRHKFNKTSCQNSIWKLPAFWSFSVKYCAPLAAGYMSVLPLVSEDKLFNYPPDKNYPWYAYVMGATLPLLTIVLVVAGILYHRWMDILLPSKEATPEMFRVCQEIPSSRSEEWTQTCASED